MARWAGWGAGPAGAGSAGGPSRPFVAVALVGTLVVTGVLAWERRWASAVMALAAAGYFAVRLLGGSGRDEE